MFSYRWYLTLTENINRQVLKFDELDKFSKNLNKFLILGLGKDKCVKSNTTSID